MPNLGDSIDRYVIEATIGEGGMGRVYRALDPRLGRRVALKVLLAGRTNERARADAIARMMREARAAAAFNHPNVVAIHDVGEVDGNPFIAMELVSGSVLRDYIDNADVSNEQKLVWLLDVARGLGAAHRAGLVHRDVKPDNVMITTDGVVKILDFGIARRAESEAPGVNGQAATAAANLPSLTAEGLMIGTPQYMAPEQLQGAPVDGRADQFAWGVMAWELFAGALPWGASSKNGAQLVAAVLATPVRPLSDVVPGIAADVNSAVARALSKSRDARFATMEDLLGALGGKPTLTPAPNAKSFALEPTAEQPTTPSAPSPRGSESGPAQLVRLAAPTTGAAAVSGIDVPVPAPAHGKHKWRRALAVTGVCVVAAAGAAAAILAKRPRVLMCAGTLETLDGPRCVVPLRSDAPAKRLSSWRLTEVGGHVQAAEVVGFAGTRIPVPTTRVRIGIGNNFDPNATQVVRGDDGAVRELIEREPQGNIVEWQKWSEGGRRVDWVDVDGKTPRHRFEGSKVTGARREFDAQGRLVSERWVGVSGRPRAWQDAYGLALQYGSGPHPVRDTVLSADGLPGARPDGVSASVASDDDTPFGRDLRSFDLAGQPTFDEQGISRLHLDFNDVGAVTSATNFDLHDQPAVILSTGAHGLLDSWDPVKRVNELTVVDERGHLRPERSNAWATLRDTYDPRGRVVLHETLGTDGNLVVQRGDVASDRLTWDEHENEISLAEFDTNGVPMLNSAGYQRRESVFDDRGRRIESHYFDEAGHPTPTFHGGSIIRFTLDDRGLELAEEYFDRDNHPFVNPQGYASTRKKYDRQRNVVEQAYFGADGRPCMNEEGISVERSTYDENDDLVSVSCLDATGAPVMYKGEYATKRLVNDERGLVIAEEYLDGHGDRTLRKEGYAALRYERDRNGDVVLASYFGKKDEPVLRSGGYAKKKTVYDLHRSDVEELLFDASGVPVRGSEGWAVMRSAYDDRGRVFRRDYFDAAKNPVVTKAGSASDTKTYDARGNIVAETTLGIDGKPIATFGGYATKKSKYDEHDELVEEALLGPDGKAAAGKSGWSVRQLRYDPSGNQVEEAFFDGERRPTSPTGASYASVRSRFDVRQRLFETQYFDGQEIPAKGPEGVAVVHLARDERGRVIETAFRDGTGAPAVSNEGKMVVRTRYDDAGHPLEELYVDGPGAPRVAQDGCAGHRRKFDLVGRKIEESCVGTKGELAVGRDGSAIRRTLNDGRGNPVEELTFGPDGVLRADSEGIARRVSQFDERDLVLQTTFFGASGKPAHDKRGAHVIRFSYDDSGKKTGETALDERGRVLALDAEHR